MPSHTVKERKKKKTASVLGRILTFGARSAAKKKKKEKIFDKRKVSKFKFSRR